MRITRVGGLLLALALGLVPTLIAPACASSSRDVGAPATTSTAPPSAATTLNSPSGNLWFIFVDDLHLNFRSTGRLRALFNTICTGLMREGDMVGSVSTGPSSIAIDLTYDRQRVEKSWARLTGSGMSPVDVLGASQTDPRGLGEVRYRAVVSMSTAYDTMVALGRVHNLRKAFIYVSNGYFVEPDPEGSVAESGVKPMFTSGKISDAAVRDHLSALTGQARRSSVRIFAVDGRRVDTMTLDPRVDAVWWQTYWATSRNSLRAMSERTGGFALLEEQDLVEGLERLKSTMRQP